MAVEAMKALKSQLANRSQFDTKHLLFFHLDTMQRECSCPFFGCRMSTRKHPHSRNVKWWKSPIVLQPAAAREALITYTK